MRGSLTVCDRPFILERDLPGDIPELTVILDVVVASDEWQRLGRRRLTRFPHVARGLTFQRCVAAAFPRPPSVT